MNTCYYEKKDENGNVKFVSGQCNHPKDQHRNGTCWYIYENGKKDEYCNCVQSHGNIKPFSILGYMNTLHEDHMITKKCDICKSNLLMRLDQSICTSCQLIVNLK